MNIKSKAWEEFLKSRIESPGCDAETLDINKKLLEELEHIKLDKEEMYEHFYKEIEFGTAGLRGILGVGTNRMNIYTVAKATQGLAEYINAGLYAEDTPSELEAYRQVKERPSVAVAYDSRIYSEVFAGITAKVLNANGIDVYLYKELMPVPALSFATRHFKCDMGVMITASHNPAKYNGYKVYDNTGCQITPDAAKKIYSYIEEVDAFQVMVGCDDFENIAELELECGGNTDKMREANVKVKCSQANECRKGQLHLIEEADVQAYLDAVHRESTKVDAEALKDLQVVYTPLNGAGNRCVRSILERIGVGNVHIVKEQEKPDGNFPTCKTPNPEKRAALSLGLEMCRKLAEGAQAAGKPEQIPDLLIATDPDCDRIGAAVRKSYSASSVNSGVGSDAKAAISCSAKSAVDSEAKADTSCSVKSVIDSDAKANTSCSTKSFIDSDAKADTSCYTKSDADSEVKADVSCSAKSESQNDANKDTNEELCFSEQGQTEIEYVMLTGNDMGVLLLDFLIERRVLTGQKQKPKAYTSIVSTKMIDEICKKGGVQLVRTLTGFKFIGEQIALLENAGLEDEYLFGFEESYGYLSGTEVRDKDGVNAAMLICEMAAYNKAKGMTLAEKLTSLYHEFGFYKDTVSEFIFEGSKGMETMDKIMAELRSNTPEEIAGKYVVEYADYKAQDRTIYTGSGCCGMSEYVRSTGLPKSNVVEFVLEDGSRVQVRPSGTEPKLKVYMSAKGDTEAEAYACIEAIRQELTAIVESV